LFVIFIVLPFTQLSLIFNIMFVMYMYQYKKCVAYSIL